MKPSAIWLTLTATMFISACGGDNTPRKTAADTDTLSVTNVTPQDEVFFSNVELTTTALDKVSKVSFTITPKTNAVSKPIHAEYAISYIDKRNLVDTTKNTITVPVFGLYQGYANDVLLSVTYTDGSTKQLEQNINTTAFTDPLGVYDKVTIAQPASQLTPPSFSYFYMKSKLTYPVIMDSDGEIRWYKHDGWPSLPSIYKDGKFIIGSYEKSPAIIRSVSLDGQARNIGIISDLDISGFHHNIETGKKGYLVQLNVNSNGTDIIESTLAEIDDSGAVIKRWDMNTIFRDTIVAGGEDPANFVRDGIDWFHMNSAIYSPQDDSIIISSRENFIVKIDYSTGNIKWIIGDQSKHWYQNYPSLQKYALSVPSGEYPIGQHALSLNQTGELMFFNNGLASANNPTNTPAGEQLNYSSVLRYAIDASNMTATKTFSYDNNQSTYSAICSSVYQKGQSDYLINYAYGSAAGDLGMYPNKIAKLLSIDNSGNILFDYELPTSYCDTSWNADILDLSNVTFN